MKSKNEQALFCNIIINFIIIAPFNTITDVRRLIEYVNKKCITTTGLGSGGSQGPETRPPPRHPPKSYTRVIRDGLPR